MAKYFADVRNTKKALAYGSMQGMGPFRLRPKKKKTAASASNTDGGEAGHSLTAVSASHDTKEMEELQA